MKKTLSMILGVLITIVLLMNHVEVLAKSAEQEELENEKSKVDSQIKEAQEKQEQLEAEKSETMKTVESLITQISSVQKEVDELESKISDLQTEISSRERDIEQKEEEYNEQEKLLDARIVALYKSGDTSYLDVLLTSSSITDFLAKYYMAEELINYDKELMQSIKQQKADIEAEKTQLEADKKELDTSLAQTEQKKTSLKSLKNEKEDHVDQLTAEEKEVQEEIEELEEENRKIANEIKEAQIRYQKQLEELKNNSGSSSSQSGSGYFIRPVSSGPITATAYYSSGKFHGAVDYGVSVGTPVKAAADGVVMTTKNLSSSYGTYVVIQHANGLQTYYAHGKSGSISVEPGEIVKQGQQIMLSGNTGNSSGPHLHFEVRKSPYNYSYSAKAYGQDSRVDPLQYL